MVGIHNSKPWATFTPMMMLIDEDVSFGNKILAAARRMGVRIEARNNITDVYKNPPVEPDILILGYDLGRVNGVQLSQYLQQHAKAKFVVLMLEGGLQNMRVRLPSCVKAVVSKNSGEEHIVAITRLLFQTLYMAKCK